MGFHSWIARRILPPHRFYFSCCFFIFYEQVSVLPFCIAKKVVGANVIRQQQSTEDSYKYQIVDKELVTDRVKVMAVNGRHVLERRRKTEDAYRSMESRMTDYKRDLQVATFEESSMLKIDRKMRIERSNELRRADDIAVANRRQCLADLLNDEMDKWRSEVLANVETQEDKKARLIERAYAFRDSREDERRRFVEERYYEQWRDASDDIRVRNSKAVTHHMSKERFQQIKDKIVMKQQLTNDENIIIVEWNKQWERAQVVDKEKKAKRFNDDMETAASLQDQIAGNVLRKDKEFQRLQREADEELADIREAMRIESDTMKQRQNDAYVRGKEDLNYNKRMKILELEEKRISKEHDKILLEYALTKEREANQFGNHKKEELRNSAIKYAQYLKEKATNDSYESSIIDSAQKRDEESVMKARDDVLQARQVARSELMRMVDDGRQEQLKSKRNQILRDNIDGQNFAVKYLANAREGIEKEKADALRRRNVSVENKDKIQDQILMKKLKDDRDLQDDYLSDKRMKYIERAQQQKLSNQGAAVRTYFPLKSASWNT